MFGHHPWPFTWPQICIWTHLKLDESMACRHLKSPRSLSGRFLHLTLVTKWSRSWSWITYSHSPCSMWIGPPILRYSYFKIWPSKSLVKAIRVVKGQGHIWLWKFKGQGYGQGQTYWSHLRPGVQSICLLFISWQSDHFGLRYTWWLHLRPKDQSVYLLFILWQSDHFWLRYSKFHIWPWKFKVKDMAKIKLNGHVWGLEFNRYFVFRFMAIRPFMVKI